MVGLGQVDPVTGIASVVVGITTSILKANATRDLARGSTRTGVRIAELEQAHIADLSRSWSKITIGVLPIAVAGAVFAAFALTQGGK